MRGGETMKMSRPLPRNIRTVGKLMCVMDFVLFRKCSESLDLEDFSRSFRCDERLKAKAEGSTRLAYTGLRGGWNT